MYPRLGLSSLTSHGPILIEDRPVIFFSRVFLGNVKLWSNKWMLKKGGQPGPESKLQEYQSVEQDMAGADKPHI